MTARTPVSPWAVLAAILRVALGIFNMFRFLSGTLGTTVFGIILQSASSLSNLGAFRLDFYLLIVVASVAALSALGLPGPVVRQPLWQSK